MTQAIEKESGMIGVNNERAQALFHAMSEAACAVMLAQGAELVTMDEASPVCSPDGTCSVAHEHVLINSNLELLVTLKGEPLLLLFFDPKVEEPRVYLKKHLLAEVH